MRQVVNSKVVRTMAEMSEETQKLAAADGYPLDTPVIEYEVSTTDLAALGFDVSKPALFYLATPRGGFPGTCILISCGYGHGSYPVSSTFLKFITYRDFYEMTKSFQGFGTLRCNFMILLQLMGFHPFVVNSNGDVCFDMTNVTSAQVDAFERCALALFVQDDLLSQCGYDAESFNQKYGGYHRQLLQYPISPLSKRIAENAKVPWSFEEARKLSNFLNTEADALRSRARDDEILRTITEANDYRDEFVKLPKRIKQSSYIVQMQAVHKLNPKLCSMDRPVGKLKTIV